MFKNIYPLFEPKRILKREMLENLRDYPRDLFRIRYQACSDGILWGCGLTAEKGTIRIDPGVLLWKHTPYVLEEPCRIPYEASGRTAYLCVHFTDRSSGNGQYEYRSQIRISEEKPETGYEIELARFKLQPGARLRDTYTDFYDYRTEFDTLDRIHAPFAAPERHSIWPQALKCFAKSLMEYPVQNAWDPAFCMSCLQLTEAMPYRAVKAYLDVRLGQGKEYSNAEIYHALTSVLRQVSGTGYKAEGTERKERKMLLV